MTKNVLISISGLQMDGQDSEEVEVISRGEYYFRNGKHYIIYEEVLEDENGAGGGTIVKCTIKMTKQKVEIIRRGEGQNTLIFEAGNSTQTLYHTPFGDLALGVTTVSIELDEAEEQMSAKLLYSLDMNYQYVSDCELRIDVRAA